MYKIPFALHLRKDCIVTNHQNSHLISQFLRSFITVLIYTYSLKNIQLVKQIELKTDNIYMFIDQQQWRICKHQLSNLRNTMLLNSFTSTLVYINNIVPVSVQSPINICSSCFPSLLSIFLDFFSLHLCVHES